MMCFSNFNPGVSPDHLLFLFVSSGEDPGRTEAYSTVTYYDAENDRNYTVNEKQVSTTTTTATIDEKGKVTNVTQTQTSSIYEGTGGIYNNFNAKPVSSSSITKSYAESNLIGDLKEAVNFVKAIKVNTGFSPIQVFANEENKLKGIIGFGDLIAGGAASVAAKQWPKILGLRVFGAASFALGAAVNISEKKPVQFGDFYVFED